MGDNEESFPAVKKRRGPYKKALISQVKTHHDVASCMTTDTPTPCKDEIPSILKKENDIDAGVGDALNTKTSCSYEIPSSSKEKDNIDACATVVQDATVFADCENMCILNCENDIGIEETINIEVINNMQVTDTESDEIDELMEEIYNETRLRDGDMLINDDITVITDSRTETLDHITEILGKSSEFEKENQQTQDPDAQHHDSDEDIGSRKLFPDSPHTLGLTMLLICCLMIRFRLPDEASSYILRIIACLLPHGNRFPGSHYHMRQFLKKFTHDMLPTIHYYCNFCYTNIDRTTKTCGACGKDLSKSGGVAYFVHLKIVSQLRALWKCKEFESEVRSHRFNHIGNNKNGLIKDIFDGKLYQKLFKDNGILSDKNNLSFSMNTDGVPLFKSSNIGMWPVYMLINELPISKRKKRQNAIFYGVWIFSKKPQMWSFLEPLFHELKHLETDGETFSDSTGNKFNCKCVLLTCTCDLPARVWYTTVISLMENTAAGFV